MGEMHPKFMEKLLRENLLKQAAEEGVLTCPTCESKLKVDAEKCGNCGWMNPLKERIRQVRKTKNNKDQGHGSINVICEHGSRFVWWWDEGNRWNYPLGRWMIVGEKASDCDCGEPPMPFKTYEQIKEYLATHKDVIQTIE